VSIANEELATLARRVLLEDAPEGDPTSELVVPATASCEAELRAKERGVLAGTAIADAVFTVAAEQDGVSVELNWKLGDGAAVEPGDLVAVVRGATRSVLRAERPAINFLAHLSAVATPPHLFLDAAYPAAALCTSKTSPGLRELERRAVAAGGGRLHRGSLSEAILVKDNHVRAAGGVGEAVRRARAGRARVEVEVESLEQLEEAIAAGADRILLDNPTPELVREAVARVADPSRLEVSGGVTLENIRTYVDAGARVVSVGRLTHSAPALDLSLEIVDAS